MKVYMFHYVTKNFNYYHFDADLFEKTIVDLMKDNNIISYSDFIYKFNNNLISENDILLTFDDGTIDHYEYVYKILKKYNLSGRLLKKFTKIIVNNYSSLFVWYNIIR